MDDALIELYQQVIIDHSRAPRNFGKIDHPTCTAHGHNPLCGDRLKLDLLISDGVIQNARFEGSGCAISTASASMLTDAIINKSVEEAHSLFHTFHEMVTSDTEETPSDEVQEKLGKLFVFLGVREFPARVKCASLCWHTLESALAGKAETSSE